MLELLACIKGFAALLERAEGWLSHALAQAVHAQTRQFLQWALANTKQDAQASWLPSWARRLQCKECIVQACMRMTHLGTLLTWHCPR